MSFTSVLGKMKTHDQGSGCDGKPVVGVDVYPWWIVQETATWCGPCIKLSRYLDRTREIWSEDFIWVTMDHRWTGARDIMTRLRDGADGDVP